MDCHRALAGEAGRAALARRDIGEVYRLLTEHGVSQRRIAYLTGQSQSEVCEIIAGRQVLQVTVLEKIADGLRIDRAWLGVSHGDAYAGSVPADADEEMDDPMKRRAFLAAASAAVWGSPVLGAAVELPKPQGEPGGLPSRLGMVDVQAIEDMTSRFRELAQTYGGHAEIVSAAAKRSTMLTSVTATDAVRARLGIALADLHTLAGWCCHDRRANDHARWHYRQALDLTTDPGQVADVLQFVGILEHVNGAPNDALKLYQIGQVRLGPNGDPTLTAWGHGLSAHALAAMDYPNQARSELAAARDDWQPANPGERADMDYQTALVATELGKVDTAEQFASAVNGAGRHRPVGVLAEVLRARLHVQTGEPDGLAMAKNAIDRVSELRSVRARERLAPLVAALAARPGSDARELARRARRIAGVAT